MRPIAAAIRWDGLSGSDGECATLLRDAPHRFAGSAHIARFPIGAVGFRTDRNGLDKGSIWTDEVANLVVVADVRIHNRLELTTQLGVDPELVSDAQLLALLYSRWQAEFVKQLVGDFALVLCDWGRREILLATGSNAARSLFYVAERGHVLVVSHPAQLSTLRPFRRSEVDPNTISDYLLMRHRDMERTFYRSLQRVAPGFRTVLRQGRVERRRFFLPPVETTAFTTSRDYQREFARLFRKCVADSVDRGAHHFVHLSGGLDSASIVCALGETYPDDNTSFDTITGVFPSLPMCNETAGVIAVQRQVHFRARYWDAEAMPDLSREMRLATWPLGLVPTATANNQDVDIAGEEGAVAVLSGDSGDGLVIESAVFRDLARHHRWKSLWDQVAAKGLRSNLRRSLVEMVLRGFLSPFTFPLKRIREEAMPTWAGPEVAKVSRAAAGTAEVEGASLPDLVQQRAWKMATDCNDQWFFEAMQMRAIRAGVEIRCPYRDQRLVAFVASIPFEHRLPDGTMRRLQREGLADLIPLEVRRRSKTGFEPAVRAVFMREKAQMDATLSDGTWLTAPYVNLQSVRDILQSAEKIDDFMRWLFLRRVWTLELWLRRHMV